MSLSGGLQPVMTSETHPNNDSESSDELGELASMAGDSVLRNC